MPFSKNYLPHGKSKVASQGANYYTLTGTLGDNNILTGSLSNGSQWSADLSALAGGGGGGSGTVVPSPQFEIPFYSTVGTSSTISGSSNITYNSTNESLSVISTVAGDSSVILRNTNAASTANGFSVFDESNSRRLDVGYNNNTNESYIWSYAADVPLKIATNDTERMRILAGGNVGIANTNPAHKLHVLGDTYISGTSTEFFTLQNGSGTLVFDIDDDANWITTKNTGAATYRDFEIKTRIGAGVTSLHVGTDGRVGVGTRTPSNKLQVGGHIGLVNNWTISGVNTSELSLVAGSTLKYRFVGGRFQTTNEGTVASPAIVDNNDTSTGLYYPGAYSWGVSTSGSIALSVSGGATKRVGIGTLTPNETLEISGALAFTSGSVTSAPGYTSLWASGSGLYWGDQEVYTNTPGSSEITGGGSSGQVTYFDGTSNVTGSANLTYNGSKLYVDADVQITSGEKLTIGDDENFQLYGSDGGSKYITTISEQLLIWNQDASGGPIKIQATDVTNGIQFNIAGTEQGRFTSTGLGIGTTSPDAKVEIISTTEQLRLTHTDASKYNTFTTTGDGSLEINRNGSASTDRIALLSGSNILLGRYAGHDLNSSQTGETVIIGNFAGWELKGNETHGRHTIIGAGAVYTMSGTTDSDYITALGANAAYAAQTTRGFITIGNSAGYYLSGSGDAPLIIGGGAGKGVALGAWGTSNGVTMDEDVLIGQGGVCEYSETLSQNTIVGSRAAGFMRVGTQNVAIGRFAMRYASGSNGTTGNVAIGQSAGHGIGQFNKTNGSRYNIAIGYETQEKNLVGDRNIAIGYKVGIDGAEYS